MGIKFSEEYKTVKEARRRELQLKQMKSRKYIENLVEKGRASRF